MPGSPEGQPRPEQTAEEYQKWLDNSGNSGVPTAEASQAQAGVDTSEADAGKNVEAEAGETSSEQPSEPIETPPEVAEAQQERKGREIRSCDVDLVLHWLVTDRKEAGVDEGFLELFRKIMEERGEGAPDNIDETRELVEHLGELFADFDKKVEELAVNKTEYSGIKGKQIEIKKSICLAVINGHFSAKDISSMITGVTIENVPPDDLPPEEEAKLTDQQRQLRTTIKAMGYVPVAEFNPDTGKITILDRALVDKYQDKEGREVKLDFEHMVNHEMSHAFTERYLVKNEKLNNLCNRIIDEPALFDLQPQHVQNAVKALENIDEKFPEVKRIFPNVTIEEYTAFRKNRAAAEIITDYTAMFMKSDGSIEGFVEKCLNLVDKKAFDLAVKIPEVEMNTIFTAKDPEEKQAIIAKLRTDYPVFGDIIDIWTSFHGEIQKATTENKGKVTSHEEFAAQREVGDNELDELEEYYEPAQSFAQKEHQSKGGGGQSVWANIGGLMKAMSDEVGGTVSLDKVIG